MLVSLKPGIRLAPPEDLVIETDRLKLRMWRESDIEPNTAMLADSASGRFITADGKPITDAFVGWRNAAVMAARRRNNSCRELPGAASGRPADIGTASANNNCNASIAPSASRCTNATVRLLNFTFCNSRL